MNIARMRKLLEKKIAEFNTKIVNEQLAIVAREIREEKLNEKYISSIASEIRNANSKEFNISVEEYQKILKEKSISEHAYMFAINEIEEIKEQIRKLQRILALQTKYDDKLFDWEKNCYNTLEEKLNAIKLSKEQIEQYINDVKHLKYDRKYVNGQRIVSSFIQGALFRTEVEGLENVPFKGPCILAIRHYHALFDPIILQAVLPQRRLFFLATAETFIAWGKKMYNTLYKLGLMPYKRDDSKFGPRLPKAIPKEEVDAFPSKNTESVKKMIAHLKYGEVVVIAPEGEAKIVSTYDNNGQAFLPIDSGFLEIAILVQNTYKISIPIIPVGIKYSQENYNAEAANNKSKISILIKGLKSTFQKVHVRFGEPITPKDMPKDQIIKEADRIFDIVKELSR